MSHEVEHDSAGGGILANKTLWLVLGGGVFVLIAFVLPTPQSLIDIVQEYGFADRMIELMVSLRDDPPTELASQSLFPWLDQIALPVVVTGLGGGRPGAVARARARPPKRPRHPY